MVALKIEKFTKMANGMYRLLLENGTNIFAHEDLILQKDLLLTKEINDEDIDNIDKLNNNYNAYDLAIKYISNKLRSCYEIEQYLIKKEIDEKNISEVINKLKKQKYIDDLVFAKAFLNDRIKFTNYGPYKIKRELEERKVSNEIIEEVLMIFNSDLERERLTKLVPKYVQTVRNKSYSMMKNKVIEYFNNLGYNKNLVIDILNNVQYDDSAGRQKEYDRLYRKYSRKYSGSELETKIKQTMYKNGYK